MIKIQDLPNYHKTEQNVIVLDDQIIYDEYMMLQNSNLIRDNKIKDLENSVKILTESIQKLTNLLEA
jgi:hypothetical protein